KEPPSRKVGLSKVARDHLPGIADRRQAHLGIPLQEQIEVGRGLLQLRRGGLGERTQKAGDSRGIHAAIVNQRSAIKLSLSLRVEHAVAGRSFNNSVAVRFRIGCRTSGAISTSGSRTKRRWCMAGWGMVSPRLSTIALPKRTISMSRVRGPLLALRRRPSSCSMARVRERNCLGINPVSMAATQFRNQGCVRSTSTGSVSYSDDTAVT